MSFISIYSFYFIPL